MKSVIFDGNNLVHRTFWVAKKTSSYDSDDIAGLHVYFTLNSIKTVIQKFKPDKVFFTWDTSLNRESRIRTQLCTDYKGTRTNDNTPHLNNQKIVDCLNVLGIPSLYPTRLEADDVISFLVDSIEGQKIIVSADKDFLQKVDARTSCYDPIRKVLTDEHNFYDVVKCNLSDFMTIKCLSGDKSDNITGIPGYGKVKIQKALGNLQLLTTEDRVIFDRNYNLFRLDRYLDEECKEEHLNYQYQLAEGNKIVPDFKKFLELCEQLNMQSILNKKEEWFSLFFEKSKLLSIFNDCD